MDATNRHYQHDCPCLIDQQPDRVSSQLSLSALEAEIDARIIQLPLELTEFVYSHVRQL